MNFSLLSIEFLYVFNRFGHVKLTREVACRIRRFCQNYLCIIKLLTAPSRQSQDTALVVVASVSRYHNEEQVNHETDSVDLPVS
jgi:hypothetical protein